MVRLIQFLLIGLGFIPFCGLSQASTLDNARQRLLLQLSSSYIQVVKELQVDIDSGLCVAARLQGLSRLPVLAEDLETGELPTDWIDRNDPAAGKRLLASWQVADVSPQPNQIRLLLLLGAYYTFRPDVDPAERDSAIGYLQKAEQRAEKMHLEKLRNQAVCLMVKYFLETNSIDKAMDCLHRVTADAVLAGDKATEAKAWAYAGIWYPFSFKTLSTRIGFMKKALELYQQEKNVTAAINTLQNIAYMSYASGRQPESEEAAQEALRLADSIRFPYTHYTTDLLALINANKSFSVTAAKYALQSIKTAEATKDSLAYGYFYKRAGDVFQFMNRGSIADTPTTEFSDWYKKSIEWFLSRRTNDRLYFDIYRLSYMITFNSKSEKEIRLIQDMHRRWPPGNLLDSIEYACSMGECYRVLTQFDSARRYLLQANEWAEKLPALSNYDVRLVVLNGLGRVCFLMGNYTLARKYYQQLLNDPNLSTTYVPFFLGALFNLYRIDSTAGHYLSAIRYFRRYALIKDSVFTVSHAKQIEALRAQFETDRKEAELKSLHSESLLQQLELKKAAAQQKITLAGAAALLLIVGLLYSRYRLKRKSSLLLEKQKLEIDSKNRQLEGLITEKDELLSEKDELIESREWLLKEIHHRVKNNLQIMMSLLNLQSLSLGSGEAVQAIVDSKNRLHAMSMIHQKLYQTMDMETIDMRSYIGEFVRYLYNGVYKGAAVRLEMELIPLQLDVAKAVPLALLLNEAITNIFKYAFPEPIRGRVDILKIDMRLAGPSIEIAVTDNGIGLPPDFDPDNSASLGMYLMRSLADQIDGNLTITSAGGVTVTIVFSPELTKNRKR